MAARPIAVILMLLLPAAAAAQQMTVDGFGGSRPNPDPTVLGLAAQREAIGNVREYFDAKLKALQDEIDRLKIGLDRVDNRIIQRMDEIPAVIEKAGLVQQQLTNEKFKGVDQQFQGRDVALAAALLAQKTSVDEQNKANAASAAKQEGAITKQIDGIQSIIVSNSKGTDDRIESVKALTANQIADLRNSLAEQRTLIAQASSRGAGQSDLFGWIIGGVGLIIAFGSIVIVLVRQAHAPPPGQYYSQPSYYPPPPPPPPQVAVVPVVPVPVPAPSQRS